MGQSNLIQSTTLSSFPSLPCGARRAILTSHMKLAVESGLGVDLGAKHRKLKALRSRAMKGERQPLCIKAPAVRAILGQASKHRRRIPSTNFKFIYFIVLYYISYYPIVLLYSVILSYIIYYIRVYYVYYTILSYNMLYYIILSYDILDYLISSPSALSAGPSDLSEVPRVEVPQQDHRAVPGLRRSASHARSSKKVREGGGLGFCVWGLGLRAIAMAVAR